MNEYRWVVMVGLCVLTACAGSFRESTLPPQHPASPQASEGPWKDPSSTLQQGAQDENKTAAAQGTEGAPEDHSGHRSRDPGEVGAAAATTSEPAAEYVCPMHPEIARSEPGSCPKCGMRLVVKKARQ